MEQANFPISRNLPLERLVTDALGEIERLGYSRRSRNRYRAIWEHLIEFSGRQGLGGQILQADLSVQLPKIRIPRDAKIPSVWEHELVVRLLEAVDRSSA